MSFTIILKALPLNALKAGIEVEAAINSTKRKPDLALYLYGRNGSTITPAIRNNKDVKNSNESVIDIRYKCY